MDQLIIGVSMPRQNLGAEEIAKLFNTKENGLHLKVRKGLLWENIWPTSSSEIRIPENITSTLLIAIPNDILLDPEEEMMTRPVKVNAFTASIYSKHWHRSGIFIVNFEQISHLVLVFLLLTFHM